MPRQSEPPAQSDDPAAEEAHLAANLRRMRQEARLTLDQLATLSGVSRAMISKIERGVSVPTATVLGKLAGALKVSLSHLLGRFQPREPQLIRREDQSIFRDPKTGFQRRALSPLFADGAVDVAFNCLPAGRAVSFPPHHAGVEEYLVVQEGTLKVVLEDRSFSVSAGDTLFFPSHCGHEFRNETNEQVSFLIVIDDRSRR
ncbi:XRE family transcriptional regulator [Xanthobacter autotrophicus DSM 597]|uniref:helix-turn-helix domain-containing protein n=1 Tax=Xanthobacter TaxID=279 RepID=UPI001D768F49|nr:XRE family transcriptional regulator [Xanthobacter flavus]MBP2150984.1 transcriptional regulator with XRE-family HTH domain [Xanthobacter flavus]